MGCTDRVEKMDVLGPHRCERAVGIYDTEWSGPSHAGGRLFSEKDKEPRAGAVNLVTGQRKPWEKCVKPWLIKQRYQNLFY